MMKSIVEEKLVSFKTLEQKIFSYVCELGREITRIMLEQYDVELAEGRDKRIYQLDRYHIQQEILRKISDKGAQQTIRALLEEEKPEEMLEYIKTYAASIESPDEQDSRSKKARELYSYLSHNREGLLPYHKQGVRIPESKEGLLYKGGSTGKPELYGNHAADEASEDALVSMWGESSGESVIS